MQLPRRQGSSGVDNLQMKFGQDTGPRRDEHAWSPSNMQKPSQQAIPQHNQLMRAEQVKDNITSPTSATAPGESLHGVTWNPQHVPYVVPGAAGFNSNQHHTQQPAHPSRPPDSSTYMTTSPNRDYDMNNNPGFEASQGGFEGLLFTEPSLDCLH